MELVSLTLDCKDKSVLLIGDSHIPYEHMDYLKFIKVVSKKWNCETIIHMGDELDYHAISFHNSESSLLNADKELEESIEILKGWNEAFSKMYLLESNHGSLVTRRMKVDGVPVRVLKSQQDLYGTPNWSWHHDILLETSIGNVYLCHGKASPYGKLAREMGCSAVQGHFHGKSEITWHNRVGHQRYNMFVGCGISWSSMAFAYGKNNLPKPILSCGIIDKNGIPHLEKMITDENGRWIGEV